MQFLIVLAAAVACALADPQVGYSYSSVAGYPTGYPYGYSGVYPGSVGYTAPVAYTATAPVAYTAASPVAYPYGYSGVYPGYAGVYPSVYDKTVEFKSRAKRAAVFPASTTKLETVAPVHYAAPHYTAPVAYTAPLGYSAPVAYSAYHGAYPVAAKAFDYKTYSPVAYNYPGYAYGHGYSYGSPVVAY